MGKIVILFESVVLLYAASIVIDVVFNHGRIPLSALIILAVVVTQSIIAITGTAYILQKEER